MFSSSTITMSVIIAYVIARADDLMAFQRWRDSGLAATVGRIAPGLGAGHELLRAWDHRLVFRRGRLLQGLVIQVARTQFEGARRAQELECALCLNRSAWLHGDH